MTKILEDQIPQNAPRCSASGIQWKIILRILLLNRMYVKLIRHYYLLCASWDWGLAKYYSIIFSLNLLKRQFSWLGAVNAQWIRLLLPSCDTVFESQTHHLCFLRYKMQQYLCKKADCSQQNSATFFFSNNDKVPEKFNWVFFFLRHLRDSSFSPIPELVDRWPEVLEEGRDYLLAGFLPLVQVLILLALKQTKCLSRYRLYFVFSLVVPTQWKIYN